LGPLFTAYVPPSLDNNATSLYLSNFVDLYTPRPALNSSSLFISPKKRTATPPPILTLDYVPNIRYFQGQWVYIKNLDRLNPKLSWDAINSTGTKWLVYNNLGDLNNNKEPGPLGIILVGQLGPFIRLRSAENNFNKNKPEFSIHLEVEERSLGIMDQFSFSCASHGVRELAALAQAAHPRLSQLA
jgi:hypothetical protein